MPVTPGFRPFIGDTILDLLKATFGDTLKEYYFGDPIAVPNELMPCVIVSKQEGSVGFGPTGMDENTESIEIRVVMDTKVELGNPAPDLTVRRTLTELVEGRDAITGEYRTDSVMGVIRKAATLGDVIINQTATVVYGIDSRGEDVYTDECAITLTVTELIPVNNRS